MLRSHTADLLPKTLPKTVYFIILNRFQTIFTLRKGTGAVVTNLKKVLMHFVTCTS